MSPGTKAATHRERSSFGHSSTRRATRVRRSGLRRGIVKMSATTMPTLVSRWALARFQPLAESGRFDSVLLRNLAKHLREKPCGTAPIEPGVEVRGRLHVPVAEMLTHALVRSGMLFKDDLCVEVSKLVQHHMNAEPPFDRPLDERREGCGEFRPAFAGIEYEGWGATDKRPENAVVVAQ